jgi:hypothetical protein
MRHDPGVGKLVQPMGPQLHPALCFVALGTVGKKSNCTVCWKSMG